jgi:hypothetical protein
MFQCVVMPSTKNIRFDLSEQPCPVSYQGFTEKHSELRRDERLGSSTLPPSGL